MTVHSSNSLFQSSCCQGHRLSGCSSSMDSYADCKRHSVFWKDIKELYKH